MPRVKEGTLIVRALLPPVGNPSDMHVRKARSGARCVGNCYFRTTARHREAGVETTVGPSLRRNGALVLSVLVLAACSAEGGPEAGCAAAPVSASPTLAHPGETVEIAVDYAAGEGCVDNFMNGTPVPPVGDGDGVYRDVTISWSQGGTTQVLATVDADMKNQLHATVTIPATAPAGQATLGVRSADNVIMTIAAR